jgi:hypothetical protein
MTFTITETYICPVIIIFESIKYRTVMAQSVSRLDYEVDDQGSRFRFRAEAGNFSLHHRVQTGSGAHPAFHPMDKGGSSPGRKAARA